MNSVEGVSLVYANQSYLGVSGLWCTVKGEGDAHKTPSLESNLRESAA